MKGMCFWLAAELKLLWWLSLQPSLCYSWCLAGVLLRPGCIVCKIYSSESWISALYVNRKPWRGRWLTWSWKTRRQEANSYYFLLLPVDADAGCFAHGLVLLDLQDQNLNFCLKQPKSKWLLTVDFLTKRFCSRWLQDKFVITAALSKKC